MKLLTLSIFIVLCLFSYTSGKKYYSDVDSTNLMLKYVNKTQTKEEEIEFNKLIELMKFPIYFMRETYENYGKGRSVLTCLACRTIVSTVLSMHESGSTEEELVDFVVEFCVTLQMFPRNVCRGAIELNAGIMLYIVDNQPLVTSHALCGIVLQTSDPTFCPTNDERFEWTMDIPEKKQSVEKTREPKDDGGMKIIHFTDAHYDPAYEAYGLAACDEPTCCRIGQLETQSPKLREIFEESATDDRVFVDKTGTIFVDIEYSDEIKSAREMHKSKYANVDEEDLAGYWGDYRDCDSPWWAFEDGVDFMAENHDDYDYVYYTGDTIDHGVWETSYDMIVDSLNDTFGKMKDSFGDVPVYPAIGNHESQPTNQYAPSDVTDPRVSTLWLYDLLTDLWSVWIPEDIRATMREGGYYTTLARPGFRIVVLNSNLCYVYNWWIHYQPRDPSGQLAWLIETLLAAEIAEEKVHIISHVPIAGGGYYYQCSREYTKITERFKDIIVGEFNGHSHKDRFKIYFDQDGEPYNVAHLGGSLTAYSHINPNYRIYEVDTETYEMLDAETWIYNLTEANLTPDQRPRWFKEYSFREHFGVDSMRPADMYKLAQRMVTTDKDLLSIDYHKFTGKSAPRYVEGTCSGNCVRGHLCDMTKNDLYNFDKCDELWELYNSSK